MILWIQLSDGTNQAGKSLFIHINYSDTSISSCICGIQDNHGFDLQLSTDTKHKKKKKVQAPRSLKYLLTKNTLFCSAQRNQNQFHTTSPNLWEQSLSSLTASDQIRNTFKNSNLLKSNSESCNLLANVFEQNKSLKRVISWVINLFL